jgi:hypothetical protein
MKSEVSRDFDILYEEICVLKSTDITEVELVVSDNYRVPEIGITSSSHYIILVMNFISACMQLERLRRK